MVQSMLDIVSYFSCFKSETHQSADERGIHDQRINLDQIRIISRLDSQSVGFAEVNPKIYLAYFALMIKLIGLKKQDMILEQNKLFLEQERLNSFPTLCFINWK